MGLSIRKQVCMERIWVVNRRALSRHLGKEAMHGRRVWEGPPPGCGEGRGGVIFGHPKSTIPLFFDN